MEDDGELDGGSTPGTVRSLPSNLDVEADRSDQSSSPGEVTYQQSASSSSNVNLNNLDGVFFESRVAHGETFRHSYPWERGYLKDIFGDSTHEVFPVVDLFDPARLSVTQHSEPEIRSPLLQTVIHKKKVYEQCVNFNSFKTKRYSESYQLEVLVQKWVGIMLHAPLGSKTGGLLAGKNREQQLSIMRTILAGKSVATLRKRSDQVGWFLAWGLSNDKGSLFPLTLTDLRDYFLYMTDMNHARSRYTGWLECAAFLRHILGVIVEEGYHSDPWVCGLVRGQTLSRPRRRQSRTFRVKEIVDLECFLEDEGNCSVDRFIAGCVLFAIFGRCRFGDLRHVERYIIDYSPVIQAQIGYIEAWSGSHKMRSAGSKNGLPLPLVAPVKGFSKNVWGRTFINVSKKVGLDLESREPGPLLPAPCADETWSDRYLSNKEIAKCFKTVLEDAGASDLSSLSPHGCKATMLAMLARYGASEEDRAILGHHVGKTKSSSVAIYSRDLQAGPLRRMEAMMHNVRKGSYMPDTFRSGLIRGDLEDYEPWKESGADQNMPDEGEKDKAASHSDYEVDVNEKDAWEQPGAERFSTLHECLSLERDMIIGDEAFEEFPGYIDKEKVEKHIADAGLSFSEEDRSESDSSESSSGSESDSSVDEVINKSLQHEQDVYRWKDGCDIYQHRKTKVLHLKPQLDPKNTFLCGRSLSAEHQLFKSVIGMDKWRCRQCDSGKPVRSIEMAIHLIDKAVKRSRKS